jgi:hypothetical protein
MSQSQEPNSKTKRLMTIWKVFSYAESKLSHEFIADLTKLTEVQVDFILASHRETYEAIIASRMKDFDNRMKKAI